MSITMAELEEAAPGTPVLVDGIEWTKTEGGLQSPASGNPVLTLHHFAGYVQLNRIAFASPWQVGRWYTHNIDSHTYYRLVLRAEGDTLVGLTWRYGEAEGVEERFAPDAPVAGYTLLTPARERTWMKRLRATVEVAYARVPKEFAADLEAYAVNADDTELFELLAKHGIEVVREHTSLVTITGWFCWTPSTDQMADLIRVAGVTNFGTVTDVDHSVNVYFSREVEVTKTATGCTCGDLNADDLYEHLPQGVDVDSWDWDARCS